MNWFKAVSVSKFLLLILCTVLLFAIVLLGTPDVAFLGSLGVDRFMLGDTGLGILKLLTGGCCGILTIIDWFTITKKAKDVNFNKVMMLI